MARPRYPKIFNSISRGSALAFYNPAHTERLLITAADEPTGQAHIKVLGTGKRFFVEHSASE